MEIRQIIQTIKVFQRTFHLANENAATTRQLLALLQEFPTGGKQVHDANIVATMLANGIDTLLTQNLKDMNRFLPKIKVVPLIPEDSERDQSTAD
jgi:predicted nucleic acid-binding protein